MNKTKKTILSIVTAISVLAVIFGLVALCMYNTYIGLAVFISLCLILLFGTLYLSRRKTPEQYLLSRNRKVRFVLQEIHKLILASNPAVSCGMHPHFNLPVYAISLSPNHFFVFMMVQAIIGNKSIGIYPLNINIFDVFAHRLEPYKRQGVELFFLPVRNMDFDLIKDIVDYSIKSAGGGAG